MSEPRKENETSAYRETKKNNDRPINPPDRVETVNLLPWSCTASGENTADQCSETTLVLCIISRPLCLPNEDI